MPFPHHLNRSLHHLYPVLYPSLIMVMVGVVVVEPERSEGVRCFTSRRRRVTK